MGNTWLVLFDSQPNLTFKEEDDEEEVKEDYHVEDDDNTPVFLAVGPAQHQILRYTWTWTDFFSPRGSFLLPSFRNELNFTSEVRE